MTLREANRFVCLDVVQVRRLIVDRQTDSFKCCCSSDVADRLSAADGERDRTPRSSACVGLAARTQRASTAPTRISQLEQKPLLATLTP